MYIYTVCSNRLLHVQNRLERLIGKIITDFRGACKVRYYDSERLCTLFQPLLKIDEGGICISCHILVLETLFIVKGELWLRTLTITLPDVLWDGFPHALPSCKHAEC